MSKVCVYLAEGFEEIEALTVVDLLRRAGASVTTVSIGGSLRVTGRSGIEVSTDEMWSEGASDGADLLFLPGGQPGTRNLGAHEGVKRQLENAAKGGSFVSAICAAPTVLAAHGLLKGKRATCYPGLEGELVKCGAEAVTDSPVVVDGKVITSRGAGTAIPFSLKLIELIFGADRADEIAKSIVY